MLPSLSSSSLLNIFHAFCMRSWSVRLGEGVLATRGQDASNGATSPSARSRNPFPRPSHAGHTCGLGEASALVGGDASVSAACTQNHIIRTRTRNTTRSRYSSARSRYLYSWFVVKMTGRLRCAGKCTETSPISTAHEG